ncbi:MAG TPA: c-type cytochrome [Fibrobacteraceae bacterium]|nr:c-type cytochrome [Fibrobacteraceae bacterium]
MRIHSYRPLPWLICGLLLSLQSCEYQRHRAHVEREAAERTRSEAFYDEFDKEGNLVYDHVNGHKAFLQYCAECHGADGRQLNLRQEVPPRYLAHAALGNAQKFWQAINFGLPEKGMPAYMEEANFRDLVDIVGYAQTLPREEKKEAKSTQRTAPR